MPEPERRRKVPLTDAQVCGVALGLLKYCDDLWVTINWWPIVSRPCLMRAVVLFPLVLLRSKEILGCFEFFAMIRRRLGPRIQTEITKLDETVLVGPPPHVGRRLCFFLSRFQGCFLFRVYIFFSENRPKRPDIKVRTTKTTT